MSEIPIMSYPYLTLAVVRNLAGDSVDECYTVEAAQSYANQGYQVEAVAAESTYWTKEKIQKLCDYELAAALDCFGAGWAK